MRTRSAGRSTAASASHNVAWSAARTRKASWLSGPTTSMPIWPRDARRSPPARLRPTLGRRRRRAADRRSRRIAPSTVGQALRFARPRRRRVPGDRAGASARRRGRPRCGRARGARRAPVAPSAASLARKCGADSSASRSTNTTTSARPTRCSSASVPTSTGVSGTSLGRAGHLADAARRPARRVPRPRGGADAERLELAGAAVGAHRRTRSSPHRSHTSCLSRRPGAPPTRSARRWRRSRTNRSASSFARPVRLRMHSTRPPPRTTSTTRDDHNPVRGSSPRRSTISTRAQPRRSVARSVSTTLAPREVFLRRRRRHEHARRAGARGALGGHDPGVPRRRPFLGVHLVVRVDHDDRRRAPDTAAHAPARAPTTTSPMPAVAQPSLPAAPPAPATAPAPTPAPAPPPPRHRPRVDRRRQPHHRPRRSNAARPIPAATVSRPRPVVGCDQQKSGVGGGGGRREEGAAFAGPAPGGPGRQVDEFGVDEAGADFGDGFQRDVA